jgi:prepilin-type N-terminal cleavage/methylation domain-containing protein
MAQASSQSGLTLLETLVAMAILGVMAAAGYGLMRHVIQIERQSAQRLERLADLQRLMLILDRDAAQMLPGTLRVQEQTISFLRPAPPPMPPMDVRIVYDRYDGAMHRRALTPDGTTLAEQRLFFPVMAMEWQVLTTVDGWQPMWPPAGPEPGEEKETAGEALVRPRREALLLRLVMQSDPEGGGPGGILTRIVALTAQEVAP